MRCFRLIFTLIFSLAAGVALPEARVASWNIEHLGWNNGKSVHAVARVAAQYDFLAVQELMETEAAEKLAETLTEKTGVRWEAVFSDALGRSTYREHYAFLWRSDAIRLVDGPVSYVDDRGAFARPPFSARFEVKRTGRAFVAGTVHITYGSSISDRVPEIRALARYWEWLAELYPEDAGRILLMGDFNLRPTHEAWSPLREHARPLITDGATTLATVDGEYANLYDNIWVPADHGFNLDGSGWVEFPDRLTETGERYWSHDAARDHVSDHAPVYALIGADGLYPMREGRIRVPGWSGGDSPPAEPVCVDLNSAEPSDLDRLVHVGPARAEAIVAGRPWPGVEALTRIRGLGPGRVSDIADQDLVCD